MSGRGIERYYHFKWSEKNRVPDMGDKWFEKKPSPRVSWTLLFFKAGKNRVQEIFGLGFFFEPFLPHVWDSVFFFQTTKNGKFSLYP